MADTKISALTALTGANVEMAADVIPIVDNSVTTTKKITASELRIALGMTLGTLTASTSGTSIDFTSIPSGVKRVTMNLNGVSTNGTDNIWVQIGDSGGPETSGYSNTNISANSTSAAASAGSASAFPIASPFAVGSAQSGRVVLELMDAATFLWSMTSNVGDDNQTRFFISAGTKALSTTLDRVRLTTSGGVNTFDAGSVNITYQF